ncbi:hypothetical protein C8Q77DRAFT_481533 [Trametes polyzona]|nr:hypothetical protein C8Q77DRAFT_481533 [Trametes polyzona]
MRTQGLESHYPSIAQISPVKVSVARQQICFLSRTLRAKSCLRDPNTSQDTGQERRIKGEYRPGWTASNTPSPHSTHSQILSSPSTITPKMQFFNLFAAVSTVCAVVVASPLAPITNNISTSIVSEEQIAHWIATTDAELTFIGDRPNPLAKRAAQSTTVTFCTKRVGGICGGTCTVYTGGATCLDAAGTTCISASKDIGFCDQTGCDGNCNALSQCGTQMGNGFCFTPNTASILVSSL